jgi:hypothetical protein
MVCSTVFAVTATATGCPEPRVGIWLAEAQVEREASSGSKLSWSQGWTARPAVDCGLALGRELDQQDTVVEIQSN